MKKIILVVLISLCFVGQAWGADYILPEGRILFSSQFQADHFLDLLNNNAAAATAWLNEQVATKKAVITTTDLEVKIIDKCTSCQKGPIVKVQNGSLKGWVIESDLKKVGGDVKKPEKKKK